MVVSSQEEVLRWWQHQTAASRVDFLHNLLDVSLPFEVVLVRNYANALLRTRYPGLDISQKHDFEPLVGVTDDKSRSVTLILLSIADLSPGSARKLFERLYDGEMLDQLFGQPFDQHVLDTLLLIYTLAYRHPAIGFAETSLVLNVLRRLEYVDRMAKIYASWLGRDEYEEYRSEVDRENKVTIGASQRRGGREDQDVWCDPRAEGRSIPTYRQLLEFRPPPPPPPSGSAILSFSAPPPPVIGMIANGAPSPPSSLSVAAAASSSSSGTSNEQQSTPTDALEAKVTSSTVTRAYYYEPVSMAPATVVVDQACYDDASSSSAPPGVTPVPVALHPGASCPVPVPFVASLGAPFGPTAAPGPVVSVVAPVLNAVTSPPPPPVVGPVVLPGPVPPAPVVVGRGSRSKRSIPKQTVKSSSDVECDTEGLVSTDVLSGMPTLSAASPPHAAAQPALMETKMYQVSAMTTIPNPRATMSIEPVTTKLSFMSEPNTSIIGVGSEKICLETVPPDVQLPDQNDPCSAVVVVSSSMSSSSSRHQPQSSGQLRTKGVKSKGGNIPNGSKPKTGKSDDLAATADKPYKVTATVGSSPEGKMGLGRVECSAPTATSTAAAAASSSSSVTTTGASIWSNGTTDNDWPALTPIAPTAPPSNTGMRQKRAHSTKGRFNRTKESREKAGEDERVLPSSMAASTTVAASRETAPSTVGDNKMVEDVGSSVPGTALPAQARTPPFPVHPSTYVPAGPGLSGPFPVLVPSHGGALPPMPMPATPAGVVPVPPLQPPPSAPSSTPQSNGIDVVFPAAYNLVPATTLNGTPSPPTYIPSCATAPPPQQPPRPVARTAVQIRFPVDLPLDAIFSTTSAPFGGSGPTVSLIRPYPPPCYCFNCGRKGHTGHECREDTLDEEISRGPGGKVQQ